MCVSGRPTDPKILPPTLTFYMPKKKKIDKIRKFVSVSDFNNFLHFLVHLIDVWNQKHCTRGRGGGGGGFSTLSQ